MVLEVIDDIGCTSDEVKEINFIDDISVSLSERVVFENCDSGAYCMDITIDPVNEVKSKTWKLNNQVIADPGNSYCYSSQSAFSSTFEVSVVHNNGCKSETSFSVDHAYPKTSEAAYFVEDTICYKDSLILIIPFTPGTNDSISLVILDAELKPELDTVIHPPSTGDYDYFEYIPDTIGVHYYHIQSLNAPELCFRDQDILAWVRGPYVVPGLVNGAQCVNRDTVYFIDVSSYFLNSTSIEYEWQFGDPDATQNIDFNPITPYKDYNYSTARNTMHFYPKISCYPSSFEVTDPVYGCTDKVEFTVTTGFPAKMGLQILDPKPLYCEGDSVYYDIFVEYWKDQNIPNDHKRLPKCAPPSGIGLETAAFVKVGPGWFTFDTDKSCEFEDMRLISGDGKTSYFPNGDTIPATISPDVCFDDTLYDDILKIDITPEINATLIEATPQGCDKIKVSLRLSSEDSIRFYKLKWSEQDSIFHDYGELVLIDTIMKLEFDTGSYYLETSVYSSCQCENTDTFSFEKGLRPMFNVTACAGQSFILDERFEYIDSTYTFTGSTGKENVSWKFDTFEWGDNLNGIIPYDTAGSFPIKMAYSDYSGKCIDTITQMVDIVKVTADFTSSNEANICEKLVKFTDLSEVKQEGNIVSWYWDFDDQLSSSELQNPYHYFLKKGVYNISLTVRSEEGCTDKITKQIDLQGPQPFFDFITDTVGCYPLTVGFVNKSTKSKVFIWEWGDNSGSTDVTQLGEDTVYFTYNQEGFYYPRITAFDTVYNEDNYYVCQDYYPNFDYGQPQRVVEVIDSVNLDFDLPPIVCQGDPIKIVNNTGAPFLVYYGIENSKPFGILGTTLRSSNSDTGFMHYTFYANTGNDRPSCSDTFTDSVYVDYVEAGFAYCISNEDSLLQTISTTNQSTYRATSYLWSDKNYFTNFSYQKEPDIQFDSGFTSYRLCLDATTSFGCTDQYCAQVYIPRLIPYNVFTPDGDGLNDTYDVSIVHENFYELAIYNRWGELVFISNQDGTDFDGNNWNGTYMNQGKDLPEGNYYYTIKYAFDTCEEEIFTIEGSITLIR